MFQYNEILKHWLNLILILCKINKDRGILLRTIYTQDLLEIGLTMKLHIIWTTLRQIFRFQKSYIQWNLQICKKCSISITFRFNIFDTRECMPSSHTKSPSQIFPGALNFTAVLLVKARVSIDIPHIISNQKQITQNYLPKVHIIFLQKWFNILVKEL